MEKPDDPLGAIKDFFAGIMPKEDAPAPEPEPETEPAEGEGEGEAPAAE